MRWIYTMVVRPLVSYAAFAWWRKSEQIPASAELHFKGMPSDHWSDEKCSFNCVGGYVRPHSGTSYGEKGGGNNAGNMQGHLKIYKDFQGVMDLHALLDRMPIRYDFEAPVKVIIYEREGWNFVATEQGILTLYRRLQ